MNRLFRGMKSRGTAAEPDFSLALRPFLRPEQALPPFWALQQAVVLLVLFLVSYCSIRQSYPLLPAAGL
jgi:hypothetical protein